MWAPPDSDPMAGEPAWWCVVMLLRLCGWQGPHATHVDGATSVTLSLWGCGVLFPVISVCLAGIMIGSLRVCVYICGCHCAHKGVLECLGAVPLTWSLRQ